MDCWDGPENQPIIYHGHTLTSKIRFYEVIKTIRDHAFATSDYPLVLSIEQHCDIPQQQVMARQFKEVFGGKLAVSLCGEGGQLSGANGHALIFSFYKIIQISVC